VTAAVAASSSGRDRAAGVRRYAVALDLVIPRISTGSTVPTSKATEMLAAVGAGFVPFIGIVYSM
jgi:hypothetical protein